MKIRITTAVRDTYAKYGEHIINRNVRLFSNTTTSVIAGANQRVLYEPGLFRKLINTILKHKDRNSFISANPQCSPLRKWLDFKLNGNYNMTRTYEAVPIDLI